MFGLVFFLIMCAVVHSFTQHTVLTALIMIPAGIICLIVFGIGGWVNNVTHKEPWERTRYLNDEMERRDKNRKVDKPNVDNRSVHIHHHYQ